MACGFSDRFSPPRCLLCYFSEESKCRRFPITWLGQGLMRSFWEYRLLLATVRYTTTLEGHVFLFVCFFFFEIELVSLKLHVSCSYVLNHPNVSFL